MNMKKKDLLDCARQEGESIFTDVGVIESLKSLEKATKVIEVRPEDVTFLSLCRIEEVQKKGQATFWIITPDYLMDFSDFGAKMHLGTIEISEIGEELYKEMKESTGLMMIANGQKILISQNAFLTLLSLAKVSGANTSQRANVMRDMHIADGFYQNEMHVKLLVRQAGGIGKCFAAYTGSHERQGTEAIIGILDALREAGNIPAICTYNVMNFITDVHVQYQGSGTDYGIHLADSDTGHSSIVLQPTVFLHNEPLYLEEASFRHTKPHDMELLTDTACKKTLKEASSAQGKFQKAMDALSGKMVEVNTASKILLTKDPSPPREAAIAEAVKAITGGATTADGKVIVDTIIRMLPALEYKDRSRNITLRKNAYNLPFLMK